MRTLAGERSVPTRAWARPRHLVSLLLMLAALVALVVALVDLRSDREHPEDFVVVLDASTSMAASAQGGSSTRLDQAIETLEDSLERLGPDDRVALVVTGPTEAIAVGFTQDRESVVRAAKALAPSGDSGSSARALAIADSMARPHDATVVFFSDGVGVSVPPMQAPLEHVSVGRAGPNVGINALGVREADALGLAEVFLAITSDTGRPREVEVELKVDDTLVDVIALDLPPRGRIERLHRVELPPGDRVVATLRQSEADILPDDDAASAPRRAGGRVSVLLVARSRRSFTAQALRLHPRVDLRVIGPHDDPGSQTYDLIVLEGPYEGERALPPAEHVLAMGVEPARVGLRSTGLLEAPEVLRWSFEDPLFRFVDLQDVEIPKAVAVDSAEVESLIDTERGSIAIRTRWDDRDLVWLGFAPQRSDLVLRVGFVNFMANAVEWASASPDEAPSSRAVPEAETRIDPPPSLPGAQRGGSFVGRALPERSWWQWLALLALAALSLETLLPWIRAGWGRARTFIRRRTT